MIDYHTPAGGKRCILVESLAVLEKAALFCRTQPPSASRSARLARLLEQGVSLISQCQSGELAEAQRRLTGWEDQGFRLVSVLDPDYPANLRALAEHPAALFMQGAWLAQDERSVAIVGTREASAAGLKRAARLARELAEAGWTVVSGLARGIDTAAHRATLQVGGRTVAVLGTGLGRSYPPENRLLQAEIAERGALVSQFAPDFSGTRYSFPMRNQIIAGLSRASVVIEAPEGSGAHNEAQAALKQGRPLWLLQSLVKEQAWARQLVDSGEAQALLETRQLVTHSQDGVVSHVVGGG